MKRTLLTIGVSLAAIAALPLMAVGATGKVTLGANPLLITYGQQTTLQGAVSSQRQNEKVSLQTRDCTSSNSGFTTTATLKTGRAGTFSSAQTPLYSTTYQAVWKNLTSNQTSVQVRPTVKFKHTTARHYRVRVLAAQNMVHHFIAFQRRKAGHWVTLKRLRLKGINRVGPNLETFVSGKSFRSPLKHGVRVRMYMRDGWTGPCYVAGKSATLRS